MAESWGPFHRHFASDAIHRDGGPECNQPGSPRPVIVFDPDYLREHDDAIRADERQRIAQAIEALPTWVIGDKATLAVDRFDAARIAWNGGTDG